MVDANVPDIALEPDKTVKKVRLSPCLYMYNFLMLLNNKVERGRGIDVLRDRLWKLKSGHLKLTHML